MLLPFIGVLRKNFSEIGGLKDSVMELQEQLEKLIGPPLQYGVFLGARPPEAERDSEDEAGATRWSLLDGLVATASHNSQSSEDRERLDRLREDIQGLRDIAQTRRDLIVGFQGHRYEVNLTTSEVPLDQLRQGQEVVLNKTMNVVAVRDHYVRGETAEVANVISAAGTARVIAVPEQGEELEVQWAGGDKSAKFTVACTGELRKTLRRGDIVQVDDEQARVTARVKPRLHVRSGGSDGIVVEISDRLFEQGVDIGDIVRVDTHLQFAFEKLPSYETGGLALEDVPDVTFADIGGLDAQIEEIRDAIELPYLHRKLFEEYQVGRTKGIMLFGPPGCGKTMIAKAVANSLTQSIRNHLEQLEDWLSVFLRLRRNAKDKKALAQYEEFAQNRGASPGPVGDTQTSLVAEPLEWLGAELRAADIRPEAAEESLRRVQSTLRQEGGIRSFFLNVKGPELLSKWVGESEHRIRKIFEEAKRNSTFHTPVIIFFDEMESLFRARGSGRSSDVETTIVPQFLAEMDGVEASENVVIIGASNRQDMIDPAVMRPGRLDVKVKVDRPGREASMAILALHLTPDLPLQRDGLEGFSP
ncbi:MAG: AAA family ATPase, partial [Victivallales bacterium]|nr:AAA family ATPase [Victivallales bacterium]